jgi:fructuronate reductase
VHFGIGAFHRAHQAVYTDNAMNAGCRDWGIVGVSLRSGNVAEQMNPQDGLYTVAARSDSGTEMRLIGAVHKVLVAAQEPRAVIEAVAAAETRIISFTITEKGYCRSVDGALDSSLADQASIYHFLKEGLALRMAAGLPGVTLLSCDNLAHNGVQLQRLLLSYLEAYAPDVGLWVRAHCTFPSSMVDRIVPATAAEDRASAQGALGGVVDEAHVVTERFTQWVIEDRFANGRPRWECAGAELVSDVASYETAKLRLLNGAHSALAYLGLEAGYDYVHQAVADLALRDMARRLMREEAAPTVPAAVGQDLAAYAETLMARFGNAALNHRLIQIAMDGSQKIPQRWLETLAWHQARGEQCPMLLKAMAAWVRHVRGTARPVDDPLAPQLAALWGRVGEANIAAALFGAGGLLASAWMPTAADLSALGGHH